MHSEEKLQLEIRIFLHHHPTFYIIHPINRIFYCSICNERETTISILYTR